MTTKPKARRFRLRLGDDAGETPRPTVAAQRSETPRPIAPARPPNARGENRASNTVASGSTRDATQASTGPTAEQKPTAPAASPAQPNGNALSNEETSGARGQSAQSAAGATTAGATTAGANARAVAQPRVAGSTAQPPAAQPPAARAPAARAPAARDDVVHSADVTGSPSADAEIEAIREEELSGRQLRMAMRVAQRNGIKATSGIEAIRLLRKKGIDPFATSTLLDIVRDQSQASPNHALTTTEQPKLPKAYRQPSPPAPAEKPQTATEEGRRKAEISRIQRDIARRRRRRMALLAARLFVFVGLPTLITAWYFYVVATPLYATNTEFVIQQADHQGVGAGGLASMFSGSAMGSTQDSITVQSYLQSRDAMRRLNQEQGFRAYFQRPEIDPLRRLPADATEEATYRLYRKMVRVSFDPTEGIVRLETIAADPATSERFATALVGYAEEQVDQLTQRLRENQMRDAQQSVRDAEQRFSEAQQHVVDLQQRYQVMSSEVETTMLTQQISTLEQQLNQERLSLADLQANARPNQARLEQAQRRIAAIEAQIASLRANFTRGNDSGTSLAEIQRELTMAQSDVATRQLLLAQAMQQQETARIEANRQVRYLSLGVRPVAPDEPTYPRAFENTALAFLIFAGLYLMISMTSAILREQVTG